MSPSVPPTRHRRDPHPEAPRKDTRVKPGVDLDPPGSGLPWIERALLRYAQLPLYFVQTSWRSAQRSFDAHAERIQKSAEHKGDKERTVRLLIARTRGTEDATRFWSMTMVLDHLIRSGNRIADIIEALSEGREPPAYTLEEVQPDGQADADATLHAFETFRHRFRKRMDAVRNKDASGRARHPWFGDWTARQWHAYAAWHMSLHRTQVQRLAKAMMGG